MIDPRPRTPAARAARHRPCRTLAVAASGFATLALVVASGCSSTPEFDREAAIGRVVEGSGGVLERAQAECFVDRVTDEVGTAPLAADAQPQPEQVRQVTAIKLDCFGVDKIGATTSVSTGPATTVDGVIPQPMAYGDDAALDALWDQCGAGSGQACDQLFDQAPINSAYEEFAGTCGNRTQELRCADVYGATTSSATETSALP